MTPHTGDRLRDKPEAFARRQYIHSHNMKFGGVRMIHVWAEAIASSKSVTEQGRAYAVAIRDLAELLERELHTRVGP